MFRKSFEVSQSQCQDVLQAAYNEALSLKLQDQLIREEEEAERLSDERQASRLAVEREKKARKKVPALPRNTHTSVLKDLTIEIMKHVDSRNSIF